MVDEWAGLVDYDAAECAAIVGHHGGMEFFADWEHTLASYCSIIVNLTPCHHRAPPMV